MMVVCQSVEESDKVLLLPLTSMKRKKKKEIKQNQHILGLYGECILRKETDMKLIITLLFKLLF